MPKIRIRKKKSENNKKPKKRFVGDLKKKVFSIKSLASILVILGLAGFVYSGNYWLKNDYLDKEKIFYGMLDKSLSTSSVTRNVEQIGGDRTEKQRVVLKFSPEITLHTKSTIEQITQSRSKSIVETETYGTKEADYIKYTNIVIPQTGANQLDYNKLIGTWAKRTSDAQNGANGPQFVKEAAFTFIPFGDFPSDKRAELISKLKNNRAYTVQEPKVYYKSGRPIYESTVSVNPRQFVMVMRQYAEWTGVGDLEQLDPSQYVDDSIFNINIQIDALSRRLTKIIYPSNDRVEYYNSYGMSHNFELPESTVSVEELQSRLQ